MDKTAQNQPKTLYLLRHAKSAWDNPNLSDFDRPLNKRGKENLTDLAKIAAILNPPPELIVTSPSRRTLDTVNGFCRGMSTQFSIEKEKELYHASREEILNIIQKVPEKILCFLLPFMLASLLLSIYVLLSLLLPSFMQKRYTFLLDRLD